MSDILVETLEIRDGIEPLRVVFPDGREELDEQCARCGSSVEWIRCPNCDEFGKSHHDCGEDSCCCLYPEQNVACDWCRGARGSAHCVSSPEWCNANPVAGRESIESTALRAEAWADAL